MHSHPQAEWPRSYAALRRIGVGTAVLDWLEFVLADGEGEAPVVAGFVEVMVQCELHDALRSSTGVLGQLKALAQRMTPAAAPTVRQDDAANASLVARLRAFVSTLEAQAWPDCVFDLQCDALTTG